MSNRKWREQFLSDAGRYGIRYEDACKLMRFGTTLQRLAEAQCNGDYPYANGAPWTDVMSDERKARLLGECERCDDPSSVGTWVRARMVKGSKCEACKGKRGIFQRNPDAVREQNATGEVWRRCANCNGRGHMLVCPDCRTTERALAFVAQLDTGCAAEDCNGIQSCPHGTWTAEFQGDPRGAVFSIVRADGVRLAVAS